MTEILIIKTGNGREVTKILDSNRISYEIYQEPVKAQIEKLKSYIETKSKEDIFFDYGLAIKDKEREAEAKEWDKMEANDWE